MQTVASHSALGVGATSSSGALAHVPASAVVSALREDGSLDPVVAGHLSDELALALYEQMVLARELDARLVALQREGTIASHASAIGEEAAILGAAAAMRDEDWVFLASRETAAAIWRGMSLAACTHHAFGTARAAGKGRSTHSPPFWKGARIVSASPLAGTQIPHAVGVAWAARLRKADVATLVFLGDGATSSGDFHAGLNFAGVTRAPVIALCRNNGFATSLPSGRQTASPGFAIKAAAYGLRGVRVDGGDVVAVRHVVREARARAAAGEGGTLIEAITTPLRSSAAAGAQEPAQAGDPAALEIPAAHDPVARLRRYLELRGLASAERDERLYTEVRADVERAIAEAASAAPAGPETLFDDVYARKPWHLLEQQHQQHAQQRQQASGAPIR